MNCDVGEATERLEDKQSFSYVTGSSLTSPGELPMEVVNMFDCRPMLDSQLYSRNFSGRTGCGMGFILVPRSRKQASNICIIENLVFRYWLVLKLKDTNSILDRGLYMGLQL